MARPSDLQHATGFRNDRREGEAPAEPDLSNGLFAEDLVLTTDNTRQKLAPKYSKIAKNS